MRPSCLDCARKHIAEAEVLWRESLMGYPHHHWLAVGHLAQAEAELLNGFAHLANLVRAYRLELIQDPIKGVPTLELIGMLTDEANLLRTRLQETNPQNNGVLPNALESADRRDADDTGAELPPWSVPGQGIPHEGVD